MSFYCNACGQNPCTGECAEPCEHGIAKREFCDDCFITSSDDQAQKPDDWTHAKAQMDHEMGVKPDASQREWPIKYVRTCDMHDRPITRDKMPMISVGAVNWLKDQLRTAHAERDALAKRVAELESRSWICYTCGDGLKPLKKLMEIENLNKELADAEAEIERLQHVINYDMPHPQLTQANARIKELEPFEETSLIYEHRLLEFQEREERLVAALECVSMQDRIRGYPTGEEWMALVDKAFAALKAHTGGA